MEMRYRWMATVLGLLLTACTAAQPAPGNPAPGNPAPGNPAPGNPVTGGPATRAQAEPVAAAPDPSALARWNLRQVASGLKRPDFLTHAGDGSGRLFVLEQPGRIRMVRGGKLLPEPFLDLTRVANSSGNERGLLGLAFDPHYRENGRFFVHYTGAQGQTVIAGYRVSPGNPDVADPGSARIVLTHPQPYANHNGGAILFGPDGYLYVALGDGGSGGDPQDRAQDLETLLGKILRLDVSGEEGYRIPPDNPFAGGRGPGGKPARREIWAYGLRNPWRISFDQATGDLYIADVGQNTTEEVDVQPVGSKGGENYGWSFFEGSRVFKQGGPAGTVLPVAEYSHSLGCSITGGSVYRGRALPDLTGTYLYADYCTGRIWGLRNEGGRWVSRELKKVSANISSFGEDEQGEVYVVDHEGTVSQIARP